MPQATTQQPWEAKIDALSIPAEVKAELWDAFELAAGRDDFKNRLEAIGVDKSIKRDLWFTKFPELAKDAGYKPQAAPATQKQSEPPAPPAKGGVFEFLKESGSRLMNALGQSAATTLEANALETKAATGNLSNKNVQDFDATVKETGKVATTPAIPLSQVAPQGKGPIASATRGAMKRVEGMTTPQNLITTGATAAVFPIMSAPLASAIGAGFALAGGAQAGASLAQAAGDLARGDTTAAAEKVGEGAVDGLISALVWRASVKKGDLPKAYEWAQNLMAKRGKPVSTEPPPEANAQLLDSILEQAESQQMALELAKSAEPPAAPKSDLKPANPAPTAVPPSESGTPTTISSQQPTLRGAKPSETGALPTTEPPAAVVIEKSPLDAAIDATKPPSVLDQAIAASEQPRVTAEPPTPPSKPLAAVPPQFGNSEQVLDTTSTGPETAADAPPQQPVAAPQREEATRPVEGDKKQRAIRYMPTKELSVDPARFQFKTNVGAKGVTEELKDVQKWDETAAGTIAVWKDPSDNKTYVINGHHRHDLASRLNVPEMAVIEIQAKDAQEARGIGALINMKEGRGTPVDAAKVLRDLGWSADDLKAQGVSLKGPVAKEAVQLSKLDPGIFEQVWNGSLAPSRGALIGEMFGDRPADQAAVLDLIKQAEAKGKRPTNDELRESIRMATADTPQMKESTDTLFGTIEEFRSLFMEKGELSDYIRKQLQQEKKLFGAVADEGKAQRLGKTGNVIKAEDNKRVADSAAQALEVYDKLSVKSGPIRDILNQGAEAIAAGGDVNGTKQRIYEAIRDAVAAELQGRPNQAPDGGSGSAGASGSDQNGQQPALAGEGGQSGLFGDEGDRLSAENAASQKKADEQLQGDLLTAEFGAQKFQGQPPVDQGPLFTGDTEPKGQQSFLVGTAEPPQPHVPSVQGDLGASLKASPAKSTEPPQKEKVNEEVLPTKQGQADAKAEKGSVKPPKVVSKTSEPPVAPPKTDDKPPKAPTAGRKPKEAVKRGPEDTAPLKVKASRVKIHSIGYRTTAGGERNERIEDVRNLPEKLRRTDASRAYFDSGDDSGVLTILGTSGKAKVELDDFDGTEIIDLGDRSRLPAIIGEALKKIVVRRLKAQEPPQAPEMR